MTQKPSERIKEIAMGLAYEDSKHLCIIDGEAWMDSTYFSPAVMQYLDEEAEKKGSCVCRGKK